MKIASVSLPEICCSHRCCDSALQALAVSGSSGPRTATLKSRPALAPPKAHKAPTCSLGCVANRDSHNGHSQCSGVGTAHDDNFLTRKHYYIIKVMIGDVILLVHSRRSRAGDEEGHTTDQGCASSPSSS